MIHSSPFISAHRHAIIFTFIAHTLFYSTPSSVQIMRLPTSILALGIKTIVRMALIGYHRQKPSDFDSTKKRIDNLTTEARIQVRLSDRKQSQVVTEGENFPSIQWLQTRKIFNILDEDILFFIPEIIAHIP